jgi:signal transduction histidine kinase
LSRQYARILRRYVAEQHEAVLLQAYELGRKAAMLGLGVLDVARAHQQALADCQSPARRGSCRLLFKASETFLLEALGPFEAAHRGFRETNARLRQLNEALEHHNTALLHVQEEERARISRELHDEVGQALTAINTNLALLQRIGSENPAQLLQRIAETQSLTAQTIDTVHRFARELRPLILDDLGLVAALRSCVRSFAERSGLRVHFQPAPEAEQLSNDQKTALFRVAQESLANVAKHARARHVTVRLRRVPHAVRLEIKDDGKGFNVDGQLRQRKTKRLGLLGMQERLRLVQGRFGLESCRGRGTTVRAEVPLNVPGNPPQAQ